MRSSPGSLVSVATALAVVVLIIGSCASLTKVEEWKGRKIDEAIAELGTPSNVLQGQNGQKTYIWILHRSVPVETVTFSPQGTPISGSAFRDSVRTWTMYVDASGIIVSWDHSETKPTM